MIKLELTAEEVIVNVATAIFEWEGDVVIQIQGFDQLSSLEYYLFNKALKLTGLGYEYNEGYEKTQGKKPVEIVIANWTITNMDKDEFEKKFETKLNP